jgi:hypothetical protein
VLRRRLRSLFASLRGMGDLELEIAPVKFHAFCHLPSQEFPTQRSTAIDSRTLTVPVSRRSLEQAFVAG